MTIQGLNIHNTMANIGLANPVQNFGRLAMTMVAMNIISRIPGTAASEVPNYIEQEICEVTCSPLPGGKDDGPEKACQEICKKSGLVTRTKEWVVDAAGTLGKGAGHLGDCSSMCSLQTGVGQAVVNGGFAAIKFFKGDVVSATKEGTIAAAKATCTAMLALNLQAPGAGYAACAACCAGLKITGTV